MHKKIRFLKATLAALLTVCIALSFCSCFSLSDKVHNNGSNGSTDFSQLELLDKLFRKFANYDIDEEKVLDAVLKAYAEATGDIYAEYYNAEEYENWLSDANAELVGIGVRIELVTIEYMGVKSSAVKIISVMDNSPALSAGLQPNDYIFYAYTDEGKYVTVDEVGYTAFSNNILGEEGTEAKFRVLRENESGEYDLLDFAITRAKVEMVSVKSHICTTDSTVGIVQISEFNLKTPYQFDQAMDSLIKKGIKRFVFDLRYNPGGDLASIVAVLSRFLEKGDLVISTIDKSGYEDKDYIGTVSYKDDYVYCSVNKDDIGKYRGYTYSVLVNKNTASAAELFTATFRDYDLANIVGVTTYGKGCMQSIISLKAYGYEGAVKMTTRYYYSMCGVGYHGIGISPTEGYEVELDASLVDRFNSLTDEEDNQLKRAIEAIYARISE